VKFKELKQELMNGKMIKRESWTKDEFVYYISHSDFCRAFKYGYGEYTNEPSFLGSFAKLNKDNCIKVGYKPKKEDREAEDWVVCGIWKTKKSFSMK